MTSHPSKSRSALAVALILPVFVYAVAAKLTRGSHHLAPEWLEGVLPNLACGAAVPVAIFLSPRALRFRDYLLFDALILFGLCAYEVAQIWMPKRTFDWNDLWASGIGAAVAVVAGAGVFASSRKP